MSYRHHKTELYAQHTCDLEIGAAVARFAAKYQAYRLIGRLLFAFLASERVE